MSKARKLITTAAAMTMAVGIALAVPGTALAAPGPHYSTVGPAGTNVYHGGYDAAGQWHTFPNGTNVYGGGYVYS